VHGLENKWVENLEVDWAEAISKISFVFKKVMMP
jgi:hypothetical protein